MPHRRSDLAHYRLKQQINILFIVILVKYSLILNQASLNSLFRALQREHMQTMVTMLTCLWRLIVPVGSFRLLCITLEPPLLSQTTRINPIPAHVQVLSILGFLVFTFDTRLSLISECVCTLEGFPYMELAGWGGYLC